MLDFPTSLPLPSTDQSRERIDVAQSFQTDVGRVRRRPTMRGKPEIVELKWTFSQAQYDAFVNWYENNMLVGTSRFGAVIAGIDGTPQVCSALFVETPQAVCNDELRYHVSAKILLTGTVSSLSTVGTPATVTFPALESILSVTESSTQDGFLAHMRSTIRFAMSSAETGADGFTAAMRSALRMIANVAETGFDAAVITMTGGSSGGGWVPSTACILFHYPSTTYTAPDGDAVLLHFSATAYTAPPASGCSI